MSANLNQTVKFSLDVKSPLEVFPMSRSPMLQVPMWTTRKNPADKAGMKSRRRMLKAKMVTVSTQTDDDENVKMSTQVDSTSSQVVSKPCWCRSVVILDMELFRKAVFVDQDQEKEKLVARYFAT